MRDLSGSGPLSFRSPAHPSDPEAFTSTPAPFRLDLPREPRRRGGLLASLVVHALVIGLAIGHGERIWSRTLAPGDAALAMGGGGGGGGNRVAYITLPSIVPSTAPRATPVTPPKAPPKPIPDPVVTPPEPVASVVPADTVHTAIAVVTPGDTVPVGTGLGAGTAGGAGGGAGAGVGTG
ncbi:MAG: hypothetical protein ACREL3_09005, partial [Gemmatimonadales bacterium]